MIEITPALKIDESEIKLDFVRASGPGGQNINKVATGVQLRFDVKNSPSLRPDIKERLLKLAGNRMTEDGILIVFAQRYRTQEQNRYDAIQRLVALVRQALITPQIRRATRPTLTSKMARASAKQRRSEIKRWRKFNPKDWE